MLDIKNYWVIEIAGVEVWITESIFNTWIIMAILITIAIIARIKLRNFKEIPTGFQNLIEAGVELFDDIVTGAMGNKLSYVAPWFLWCLCLFSHQVYLVLLVSGHQQQILQLHLLCLWLLF